jgi:hypothetical protein
MSESNERLASVVRRSCDANLGIVSSHGRAKEPLRHLAFCIVSYQEGSNVSTRKMAKKKAANLLPKLTETEQDLLSHMQDGYQLETDSLGGNPVLRRLKDNEEIRPLSANRNTIKAMEQRGLISPGKGRDPLTIAWRLKKKQP